MKKMLPILFTVLLVLSLCACASNTAETKQPVQEKIQVDTENKSVLEIVREEIVTVLEIDDAMLIETDKLNSLYGIDSQKVENSACFVTMSGTFPHEIIMVEAKSKEGMEEIASVLEKKLSEVLVQSKSYDAENYALAQQCRIFTKDNFVVLFLSPQHAKMQTILEKYI